MVKFPEAQKRMFHNVYVCRSCKTKMRSIPKKVNLKLLVCKKCGKRHFRAIKKGAQKAAPS
ncbi:MAG: hypothetical protein AABW46_01965 [Nanoarchaeota archaeon]